MKVLGSKPNSPKVEDPLRLRPWATLALLPLGTLAGAFLGAALAVFNCWLRFMEFALPALPLRASKAALERRAAGELMIQMLEAKMRMLTVQVEVSLAWKVGLLISLILVVAIALISKFRCPFRLAVGVQLRVVKFALGFWLIGGINALVVALVAPTPLALLFQESKYVRQFGQVATPTFLRDAWIWGSKWGPSGFGSGDSWLFGLVCSEVAKN